MISSAAAEPGETVTLYIAVAANDNLCAVDTVLSWSPELTVDNVDFTGAGGGSYDIADNFVALSRFGAVIQDGDIAEISFTIPEDAEPGTEYSIDFVGLDTVATLNGDITDSIGISGGTITVAISEMLVRGDANEDGVLNICDAALICEYASKLSVGLEVDELPACADYNGDGHVNIRDAADIAKYLTTIDSDISSYYPINRYSSSENLMISSAAAEPGETGRSGVCPTPCPPASACRAPCIPGARR